MTKKRKRIDFKDKIIYNPIMDNLIITMGMLKRPITKVIRE